MVAMPACVGGLRGGERRPARPSPGDLARVRAVRPGQHLDQRRLAGAVLAEQAVHLAGLDVEVHAVERADAGELLDDARASSAAAPRPSHIGVWPTSGVNIGVLTSAVQRPNNVVLRHFFDEIEP